MYLTGTKKTWKKKIEASKYDLFRPFCGIGHSDYLYATS